MSQGLKLLDDVLSQLQESDEKQKETSEPNEINYSNYSKTDSSNAVTLDQNVYFKTKYDYPLTTDNFPKLQNTNVIDAAMGRTPQRLPIWLHRQAGRYMSEFREIRSKFDFFTLCKTPQLTCEVTLQPINKFKDCLDAAIIFSDILVISPIILNSPVNMVSGIGPVISKPLQYSFNNENSELEQLNIYKQRVNDISKSLSYVYQGITLTRHALEGRVPLIGFVGGPWTLLAYMIDGQSSKSWTKSKEMLVKHTKFVINMMDIMSDAIITHAVNQIKAGAQLLEVFESTAGALSPQMFEEYVLPSLKRICQEIRKKIAEMNIKREVPLILFAREAHDSFETLLDIGYDVLSVDWGRNPTKVREIAGDKVSLQGNFDPWLLFGDKNTIEIGIYKMLDGFEIEKYKKRRLIINLGHGMLPNHEPRAVEDLVSAVRKYEKERF